MTVGRSRSTSQTTGQIWNLAACQTNCPQHLVIAPFAGSHDEQLFKVPVDLIKKRAIAEQKTHQVIPKGLKNHPASWKQVKESLAHRKSLTQPNIDFPSCNIVLVNTRMDSTVIPEHRGPHSSRLNCFR